MLKLWHDDIRLPPRETGWVWARTNEQAKVLLAKDAYDTDGLSMGPLISECSLDHDLGCHDKDADDPESVFLHGVGSETGLDLVNWMCDNERVPAKVTIHSWNPEGAGNMAARLNYYGYDCFIAPYRVQS